MIELSLLESTRQAVSGIPEYIEFESDVPSNIFYTLDESTPDSSSLIALGNIYLPTNLGSVTVKAVAISSNDSSEILEHRFYTVSTDLDGPRRIGEEGISVIPFGSEIINNLSEDLSGSPAQGSSVSFEDLDIKASVTDSSGVTLNPGSTSISFINTLVNSVDDDRFFTSEVNDNHMFDPSANVIVIDGTTQEKLDNQVVKIVNRTYNSIEPAGKFYRDRAAQSEPVVTGNYIKSFLIQRLMNIYLIIGKVLSLDGSSLSRK